MHQSTIIATVIRTPYCHTITTISQTINVKIKRYIGRISCRISGPHIIFIFVSRLVRNVAKFKFVTKFTSQHTYFATNAYTLLHVTTYLFTYLRPLFAFLSLQWRADSSQRNSSVYDIAVTFARRGLCSVCVRVGSNVQRMACKSSEL